MNGLTWQRSIIKNEGQSAVFLPLKSDEKSAWFQFFRASVHRNSHKGANVAVGWDRKCPSQGIVLYVVPIEATNSSHWTMPRGP